MITLIGILEDGMCCHGDIRHSAEGFRLSFETKEDALLEWRSEKRIACMSDATSAARKSGNSVCF